MVETANVAVIVASVVAGASVEIGASVNAELEFWGNGIVRVAPKDTILPVYLFDENSSIVGSRVSNESEMCL
jgi:hypothetical protein